MEKGVRSQGPATSGPKPAPGARWWGERLKPDKRSSSSDSREPLQMLSRALVGPQQLGEPLQLKSRVFPEGNPPLQRRGRVGVCRGREDKPRCS